MAKRFNPIPPNAVNKVYRFKLIGTLFGQTIINRLDYIADSLRAGDDLRDFAGSVWDHIKNQWLPCVTADYTAQQITGEQLSDLTVDFIQTVLAGPPVGTHAGQADTSFVQMPFLKETNWRGQHGRGAMRMAGIATTEVLGNVMTNAQKTLNNALATVLANRVPSNLNPALGWLPTITVHVPQSTPPNPSPPIPVAAITFVQVNPQLSTQRSRHPRPTT